MKSQPMSNSPLIDPAKLTQTQLDLLMEMLRSIFANATISDTRNDWADHRPNSTGQQYLVKSTHVRANGYRPKLEQAIATQINLNLNSWTILAVSKGVNALRLAFRALRVTPNCVGGEVLLPAVTAAATAEAALMEGLHPVLVDVDPESWHLDLEKARAACSNRTVAVVSVDWLGTPVDIEAMQRFVSQSGLVWISDSAQSFGARWRRRPVVDAADATIFSTGYPKVFHTAGRGGLLVIRDKDAINLEIDPTGLLRHEVMPEINAAFGLCLLPSIDEMIAHRKEIAALYRDRLGTLSGLHFQKAPPHSQSNAYQISVRVDENEFGVSANRLANLLQQDGIHASAEQVRCLSLLPQLQDQLRVEGGLSQAESLHHHSLTLPISNHLRRTVCEQICDRIQQQWQR